MMTSFQYSPKCAISHNDSGKGMKLEISEKVSAGPLMMARLRCTTNITGRYTSHS